MEVIDLLTWFASFAGSLRHRVYSVDFIDLTGEDDSQNVKIEPARSLKSRETEGTPFALTASALLSLYTSATLFGSFYRHLFAQLKRRATPTK